MSIRWVDLDNQVRPKSLYPKRSFSRSVAMSAIGGITCYKVQQKQGAAYRAALTIGHGSKGARRKTVTRKTKDEALKAIYALRADFDRGILKSRGKTVVHDLAMTYFSK